MTYTIISKFNMFEFCQAVNQALANGWTLYGSPWEDCRGCYCQAMIRGDNHDAK